MASIGGLTGFDGASLVDQLMQLETVPQTKLKTRLNTESSLVTTLQGLNTRLSLLASKAEDLAKATAWTSSTTTSNNAAVRVSTDAGAASSSFSVTVSQVALTHQVRYAAASAADAVVTGADTHVTLSRGADTITLDTGDGTLQGLADAINEPANDTGLRATLFRTGDGSYELFVESTATGTAQDFELTAVDVDTTLLGGVAAERAGQDAQIVVGIGTVLTSASNTFEDVIAGVDVTLDPTTAVGVTASVTVARDTAKVRAAVAGLVEALNGVLTEIDTHTKFDSANSSSGKLVGESALRGLRTNLLDSVYPGDGTSLVAMGIQTDRYGKLVFDAAAFDTAYAADPEGVAAQFTTGADGFAARVQKVADRASDPIDGTLTQLVTGRKDGIKRIQDSIESWDMRLELRRTSLTRQFTALEVALAAMATQSSWLAGQLDSLPSNSS